MGGFVVRKGQDQDALPREAPLRPAVDKAHEQRAKKEVNEDVEGEKALRPEAGNEHIQKLRRLFGRLKENAQGAQQIAVDEEAAAGAGHRSQGAVAQRLPDVPFAAVQDNGKVCDQKERQGERRERAENGDRSIEDRGIFRRELQVQLHQKNDLGEREADPGEYAEVAVGKRPAVADVVLGAACEDLMLPATQFRDFFYLGLLRFRRRSGR